MTRRSLTAEATRNRCSVKGEKPLLRKSKEIYKNLETGVANKSMQHWPKEETKMSLKGCTSPCTATASKFNMKIIPRANLRGVLFRARHGGCGGLSKFGPMDSCV